MYRVMIVDDEACASNFIKQIIEKKCPGYEIAGIAENGKQALERISVWQPDVVISDIRMPVMDGIELVERLSKEHPNLFLVLVTGFQEFEYAQKALRAGVSEYLLKPVKLSEMVKLMEALSDRLDRLYYERQIRIFNDIVNHKENFAVSKLKQWFEPGEYCAVLIRKKGLPKRFSTQNSVAVYSMENEKFFMYGRDEMEALYLINKKYLFNQTFDEITQRIIDRFTDQNAYITCIKEGQVFLIEDLPKIVHHLYRKLDWEIIIGKNQIISACRECNCEIQTGELEHPLIEKMVYYIKYKELHKLRKVISSLFDLWEREKRTQMYVEKQVEYIFYLLNNAYNIADQYQEMGITLAEAFAYVENMKELKEVVMQIIMQLAPDSQIEQIDNKTELFREILNYLDAHIHEEITLVRICRYFGISQTSLSRLFRNQKGCSFSNYLTKQRIGQAQRIMDNEPDIFIKDVAERVGYKDQFYFSRIFRSVVLMSPSEYMDKGHSI